MGGGISYVCVTYAWGGRAGAGDVRPPTRSIAGSSDK